MTAEDTSMFGEGLLDDKLRVSELLHHYPRTRGGKGADNLLVLLFWIKYDRLLDHVKTVTNNNGKKDWWIDEDFIKSSTPAETITRLRRFIQNNEKKYLPSEEVQDARREAEQKFRRAFGKVQ